MAIELESHPFWAYSLDVYRREGVSPALIGFQDRHGLDVNILLLCLWAGQAGRGVLDDEDFAHALQVSANWNPEIVCALRDVRIRLRQEVPLVRKELSEAVRKNLLELEIACEQVEQLSIAAGLSPREDRPVPPEEGLKNCGLNLKSYFDRKGCVLDAQDRSRLEVILSAAFGDVGRDRVRALCAEMFG